MPRASFAFDAFVRRVFVQLAGLRHLTRKRQRGRGHAHGWWRNRRRRVTATVVIDHFEAISGANSFAAAQRAQPPAIQSIRVLLDDIQKFSLAKCQLIDGLRDVIVNRLRLYILEWENGGKVSSEIRRHVSSAGAKVSTNCSHMLIELM